MFEFRRAQMVRQIFNFFEIGMTKERFSKAADKLLTLQKVHEGRYLARFSMEIHTTSLWRSINVMLSPRKCDPLSLGPSDPRSSGLRRI
jgi:hypothetical protein